ncbi:hypothetical protein [Burkholderia multivorans]|uniref:hypothetical protein n=1 Tax=Burkholderia multivorans TaxID=87883 RepID=UPI00215940B1|nr:hypothetical protein [Burkholderia multivorans]
MNQMRAVGRDVHAPLDAEAGGAAVSGPVVRLRFSFMRTQARRRARVATGSLAARGVPRERRRRAHLKFETLVPTTAYARRASRFLSLFPPLLRCA